MGASLLAVAKYIYYGNLAVLSNPALTGELHWLSMKLKSARPWFNFLQDQLSGS